MKSETTSNIVKLNLNPDIIPREQHNISRADISDNALKVLYRLKNAGFKAYLVGGAVRDLLLNIKPKDFDVVTDAHPEQIRELFRNSRLIGRRFRLAHVRYGKEIIEVSTFRAGLHVTGERHTEQGRIIRDNVYGDIDEDVWRRDFTVNALLYNIRDFSVVDYFGGMKDLQSRQLRLIGEPEARYREDPVRMLRAVRFAVKLSFSLHPDTEKPVFRMDHLLSDISSARLFEEFMKLFMTGQAHTTYRLLRHYGLLKHLFPDTETALQSDSNLYFDTLLARVMDSTDSRIADGKPVTPAFLVAALLWEPLNAMAEEHKSHGLAEMDAIHLASDAVISRQISSIAIPRRFTRIAREIWALQSRLKHTRGNRPFRLLSHPRFRAAYDFLLLRAESGENVDDLARWWTDFVENNSQLVADPGKSAGKRSHGPRRRKRRSR